MVHHETFYLLREIEFCRPECMRLDHAAQSVLTYLPFNRIQGPLTLVKSMYALTTRLYRNDALDD